ncbi:hypothetical protein P3X46_007707 [Hevea brasiliensis]|uniref:Bet v I/Major latex protein domain-containing protein n=1 Tax=Hevea brasiliensis TaxID=3981 RepID=A0ABQ9MY23_HEVBR|nr:uncharacterized protein LOC110641770 [Hevea brasiliensis]KAJ9183908.1 hypothetical protein P3X46_007707 [Hevea brasiliensis]
MADYDAEKMWEGAVSAKLTSCRADQIWPLLEDFFNFGKCLPGTIDTCYGIEGISGQPGCIRYCAKTSISDDGSGEMTTIWANEKLLAIDPDRRCLSYSLQENSIGFKSHMATIKLLPLGSQEQEGCEVVWSFTLKPIEGQTIDHIVSLYDSCIQAMAKHIEDALQVKSNE